MFKKLNETVDDVSKKLMDLGKITENLNATTIGYGKTIDNIEDNLDKLEETLGKGSSDVEQLKKKIEDIQPDLVKTMKKEKGVVDEINKQIKGNKRKRKKRNTCKNGRCSISEKLRNRKKRQLKRKRRQSNKEAEKLKQEQIQKIKQLLANTIKLQNDIADYREGSDDYFFKTYIESIQVKIAVNHVYSLILQKNQENAKEMEETMDKVCKDCATHYENAAKNLSDEISELRVEAEKFANGIFKCVKDPCWQKHLLDGTSTTSPCV